MASEQDPQSKGRPNTVLGAAGAATTPRPAPTIGGEDVAETFMDPGPRVTGPPVARPITSPPEARPPTGPPPGSPRVQARSATVLGASGASSPGQVAGVSSARATPGPQHVPAHTAPEIGGEGAGNFGGLDDLPQTDPERWIGQVMADRYRILRLLGQGGMGVVYLAEHVVIEKKVALKVLNEELSHSRDVVSRFIGEAKAASRIGHENIIDITDFGTTKDKGVFFVMEHLDGSDLADRLKAIDRFPWRDLRGIAVQICRGLAAAHSKGIIHRDLKPENVFLIKHAGRDDFVKILDFGIAKFTGLDGGEPKKTKTGVIFGTPDYMSPEQAEGKQADHRVDIYALGVILYELVTGRLPFVAETFMGVLHQHMSKEPQPPRDLVPDIAPAFEAIIQRAMEKDPAARFQSMNEFAEALEGCEAPSTVAEASIIPRGEPASVQSAQADGGLVFPPMTPQSNIATGRVASLDDATELSPTSRSAVEVTVSPVAAEARSKKSAVPVILVVVVVTLALGAGAFFFMRQRGKRADKTSGPPGGTTAMTVPPAALGPDAAAAMAPVMLPPPRPIYVTPDKVTLTLKTTPRRVKATVFLDGKLLGTAPLRKKAIPYSTQERTLEIRASRHKTVQIKFTPDANQSWERRLVRGRGTTKVVSMRTMRVMDAKDAMDAMDAMGTMKPDMVPQMRVPAMPPEMRPPRDMDFKIKDPFARPM